MIGLQVGTKVYVGADFEIEAVITAVIVRGCGCPIYTIDWWAEGCPMSSPFERYQFSIKLGAADDGQEVIEAKE